jgi:hypothetical protein
LAQKSIGDSLWVAPVSAVARAQPMAVDQHVHALRKRCR